MGPPSTDLLPGEYPACPSVWRLRGPVKGNAPMRPGTLSPILPTWDVLPLSDYLRPAWAGLLPLGQLPCRPGLRRMPSLRQAPLHGSLSRARSRVPKGSLATRIRRALDRDLAGLRIGHRRDGDLLQLARHRLPLQPAARLGGRWVECAPTPTWPEGPKIGRRCPARCIVLGDGDLASGRSCPVSVSVSVGDARRSPR